MGEFLEVIHVLTTDVCCRVLAIFMVRRTRKEAAMSENDKLTEALRKLGYL